MEERPVNIIQISDMHVFGNPKKDLLGVPTQKSLQAVVDLVKQAESGPIDMILLSGDLSQDGSKAAYLKIADIFKNFDIPIYCIPGNHDDMRMMSKVYPINTISNDKQIVFKHWQVILLNSQIPGLVKGQLAQTELDFMEKCLKAYPNHYAMIVFHHQPFSVGCEWLDELGISNADEFWQIAAKYPKIKTIVFGHVHQEGAVEKNGIKCFYTPSTCIQFKSNQADFGLDNIPPGYRKIELYADGRIVTSVLRIASYVGRFDDKATGY